MTSAQSAPFPGLADHEFVRLTTFRRSGEPVGTAMWFAPSADGIVLSTPAGAGKLKRLRHTSRVQLQACSRSGEPVAGAPVHEGHARVVDDAAERRTVERALSGRYGWQWRVALAAEQVLTRVRLKGAPRPRVAIVVTASPSS